MIGDVCEGWMRVDPGHDFFGRELLSETVRFAMPATMSSSETFDIGRDDGKALTEDYTAETPFPGTIRNVEFDFMPRGLEKVKMILQAMGSKARQLLNIDSEASNKPH